MKTFRAISVVGVLVGFTVCAGSVWASTAEPPKKPYLMASLGDSLTAAMLANTSATLGASDSAANSSMYDNKATLSWASGASIQSQYQFLSQYLKTHDSGDSLVVLNEAISGSGVESLVTQADAVAKELATGKYQGLKYVTILSGDNNLCSDSAGTPEFYAGAASHFKEALSKIDQMAGAEPVHVLVSSFAKSPDLMLDPVRDHYLTPFMTCGTLQRQVLRYCDNMLGWSTPEEYEEKVRIVVGLEDVERQAVEEAKQTFHHLDLYYSSTLMNQRLDPAQLAIDCFHPNAKAQEAFSEALWKEQPFFR